MDQHLLFLLNQKWTNPVFDRLLGTLSCLAFWIPILACIAIWMLWKKGIRGRTFVALCVLSITANETLVSQPLKTFTNKARPHESLENVRRIDLAPATPRLLAILKPMSIAFSGPPPLHVERGRSFPSAHVMNAVSLSLIIALCWKSWLWLLLPPLMAWSRVYTGAHWPSDVCGSLLIGTLFTLLVLWICENAWRRWVIPRRPSWGKALPNLILSYRRRNAEAIARNPSV